MKFNWCHPQGHHTRRPPSTVPTWYSEKGLEPVSQQQVNYYFLTYSSDTYLVCMHCIHVRFIEVINNATWIFDLFKAGWLNCGVRRWKTSAYTNVWPSRKVPRLSHGTGLNMMGRGQWLHRRRHKCGTARQIRDHVRHRLNHISWTNRWGHAQPPEDLKVPSKYLGHMMLIMADEQCHYVDLMNYLLVRCGKCDMIFPDKISLKDHHMLCGITYEKWGYHS